MLVMKNYQKSYSFSFCRPSSWIHACLLSCWLYCIICWLVWQLGAFCI